MKAGAAAGRITVSTLTIYHVQRFLGEPEGFQGLTFCLWESHSQRRPNASGPRFGTICVAPDHVEKDTSAGNWGVDPHHPFPRMPRPQLTSRPTCAPQLFDEPTRNTSDSFAETCRILFHFVDAQGREAGLLSQERRVVAKKLWSRPCTWIGEVHRYMGRG